MQRILKTAAGQMLFDPDRIEPPKPEFFDPDWWQEQEKITSLFAGRGQAIAVRGEFGNAVLKQYFRGGWVRRISRERYVYLGSERTRSFREWHITQQLWQAGLPVAEPLTAFFNKTGISYRAALITRQIEQTQTLAEVSEDIDQALWQQIGITVARFAAFGLHHPDLNARNILIDTNEKLWWIDFDRARIANHAVNPKAMHQRLLRSLKKLSIEYDTDAIQAGMVNKESQGSR